MLRDNVNDLIAFAAIAEERSFTRAAAQLGVSQSALSHAMRGLEERLGVRLLTRTTRSVAPTEAGERLLARIGPRFGEIEQDLIRLVAEGERPAGTVRITATDHAARTVLWPALRTIAADHPEIRVEVVVDYRLADIVRERFDAGIRYGETVDKDMVAIRIGPDVSMAAVAAPAYLARRPAPRTPQELTSHSCINLRLPTRDGLYPWEFQSGARELRVRVDGQFVFNTVALVLDAALDGMGIAYVPEDLVRPHIAEGRLVRLLERWCQPFSGYHLYYPSRRQNSPAFTVIVEALRIRR